MPAERGRQVRARPGLNRSVLEETWGVVRQQLRYQAERAGREFVEVHPAFTSQDCHACGERKDPGGRRVCGCPSCGLSLDRDLNAAINMGGAGNLALAPGTCRDGESVGAERHAQPNGHSGL